jgi:predicted DNA-binding transcriptional regulator AlpA
MKTKPEADRVIWRPDLAAMAGVTSQSIKLWIRSGKLPAPDVALSQKTMGWRLSTLRAAGVNLV